MGLGDSVGLLVKIRADSDDARKDIQKFKDDLKSIDKVKKDSLSTDQELAARLGMTAQRYDNLRTGAFAAAAAITAGTTAIAGAAAGLFLLAKNASDAGSEIYDASQKLGLSAEFISSFKLGLDEAGSSLEKGSAAISKFTKLVGDAASGSQEAKDKLTQLGIDPQKAITDLEGTLADLFKRIADAKDPVTQTKLATDAFGRSGAELIPFIKGIDGNMAGLIERAKKLGVVLTEEDVKAADEFGDTLTVLQTQAGATANKFALQFAPAITKAMTSISAFLSKNQSTWQWWGNAIGMYINHVRGAMNSLIPTLEAIAAATRGDWAAVAQKIAQAVTYSQTFSAPPSVASPNAQPESDGPQIMDLAGQRTAAEETRKLREQAEKEDRAGRVRLYSGRLADLKKWFDDQQKVIREAFEKSGDTETFASQRKSIVDFYAAQAGAITNLLNAAEKEQALIETASAAQRQVIFEEQQRRMGEIQAQMTAAGIDNEELLVEVAKDGAKKKEKLVEEEAGKKIALDQSVNATLIASYDLLLQQKLISEREYAQEVGNILLFQLELERALATDKSEIAILDQKIAKQKIENAQAVAKAIEGETNKITKQREELEKTFNSINESLLESTDNASMPFGGPGAASAFDGFAGMAESMTGLPGLADGITSSFSQMANAVGQAVSAFVLFGDAGTTFRKFAAQMIASIAQMAIVQAVWETAQGFAKLALAFFGHPTAGPSATAHFTAAAIYAGIGTVSAGIGRAAAGGAFRDQTATSLSGTSSGASGNRQAGAYSGRPDLIIDQSISAPANREITVNLRLDSNGVLNVIEESINRNGRARNFILKVAHS